ncbi:MAG: CCA tRNA nucleotidyltransferase [Anaerolineales bacterium]|nr:CCA tRNA nucleotidyltransferase [Anaerolineales bacterium]
MYENYLNPEDVRDKLVEQLTPGWTRILEILREKSLASGAAVYLVGGIVRDLILEMPVKDLDIIVDGNTRQLVEYLVARYGGKTIHHPHFGTSKWIFDSKMTVEFFGESAQPEGLDFVRARAEWYQYPGALPTTRPGSIDEDLKRRDFSINTLAIRLDGEYFGELVDICGGLEDLEKGEISVLHKESFEDDPTRLFRAVRFEKRFGFTFSKETLDAVKRGLPVLHIISGDRIRHELDRILWEEKRTEMLRRLDTLGLMEAIHPDMRDCHIDCLDKGSEEQLASWSITDRETQEDAFYGLWLGKKESNQIDKIAERLMFSKGRKAVVSGTSLMRTLLPEILQEKPSLITKRLRGYPVAAVVCGLICSEDTSCQSIIQEFLSNWQFIELEIGGKELIDLGIKPGPLFSEVLEDVLAMKIDGDIQTREEELKNARKYLN